MNRMLRNNRPQFTENDMFADINTIFHDVLRDSELELERTKEFSDGGSSVTTSTNPDPLYDHQHNLLNEKVLMKFQSRNRHTSDDPDAKGNHAYMMNQDRRYMCSEWNHYTHNDNNVINNASIGNNYSTADDLSSSTSLSSVQLINQQGMSSSVPLKSNIAHSIYNCSSNNNCNSNNLNIEVGGGKGLNPNCCCYHHTGVYHQNGYSMMHDMNFGNGSATSSSSGCCAFRGLSASANGSDKGSTNIDSAYFTSRNSQVQTPLPPSGLKMMHNGGNDCTVVNDRYASSEELDAAFETIHKNMPYSNANNTMNSMIGATTSNGMLGGRTTNNSIRGIVSSNNRCSNNTAVTTNNLTSFVQDQDFTSTAPSTSFFNGCKTSSSNFVMAVDPNQVIKQQQFMASSKSFHQTADVPPGFSSIAPCSSSNKSSASNSSGGNYSPDQQDENANHQFFSHQFGSFSSKPMNCGSKFLGNTFASNSGVVTTNNNNINNPLSDSSNNFKSGNGMNNNNNFQQFRTNLHGGNSQATASSYSFNNNSAAANNSSTATGALNHSTAGISGIQLHNRFWRKRDNPLGDNAFLDSNSHQQFNSHNNNNVFSARATNGGGQGAAVGNSSATSGQDLVTNRQKFGLVGKLNIPELGRPAQNLEEHLEYVMKIDRAKIPMALASFRNCYKNVANFRKACSFKLRGHCRKDDCEFSHDPSNVICRFWQSSGCFNLTNCRFKHWHIEGSYDPQRNVFNF